MLMTVKKYKTDPFGDAKVAAACCGQASTPTGGVDYCAQGLGAGCDDDRRYRSTDVTEVFKVD